MPLVPCPDCGREISDLAPSCIHCGRPLRVAEVGTTADAPPARPFQEHEAANATPGLPKPVAGIATVLVLGGAGLIWAMMPDHPKDPDSLAASLAVVSKGVNTLGNSAAIIGALMAAMNHRAGHRVVRAAAWTMMPLLLLFVLIAWTVMSDNPVVNTADRSAIVAGVMALLAVVAVTPWLLFLYLFRVSRYG